MWSRACPLLTGVLAAGLILTRRHLHRVQAELDRARAEAASAHMRAAAAPNGQPAAGIPTGSDLSSEWEQAVPPMDS